VLRRSLFEKVLREFGEHCRATGHEATFHVFLLRDVKPVREGTPVPTYGALAEECHLPSENFANKLSLAAREEFRGRLLAATSRDCATPEEAHAECELTLATALRD
jgi:hypothetical protein